jgi:phage terminase small subunit
MSGERRREDREAARTTQGHVEPMLEPDEAQTASVPRNLAVRKPKPRAERRPGAGQQSQGRGSRGYVGGMTEMQARFVEEYLKDMNARQAAIRAGYAANSAHVMGHRLRNANRFVKAAIDARVEEARAKVKMSAEEVLERMTALARANMADFAYWDERGVKLRPSSSLTPAQQYAIDSVGEDPGITGHQMQKDSAVKIKLRDPLPALVHLGKIHGVIPAEPTVRAFSGPRGTAVQGDGVGGDVEQVVLILPDNGRGDGPTPLPPLPRTLPSLRHENA